MKKYSYSLTKSTVQVYRFRAENDKPYWADVTIDTAAGAEYGRISIASDFGNWQHYWGACGDPFKKFLAGLDIHYAAGKFGADNFFNLNSAIQGIEETAQQHVFATTTDHTKVMREIDNLRSCSNNKEEFCQVVFATCPNIMSMYDTGPDVSTEIDPGFKNFWEQIWPELLAEFTKEATEAQPVDLKEQYRLTGMTQGLALAVNYLLRGENAEGIWSSGGMTVRECIAQGVDNFDLDRLIPQFATPEDAEAIANYYVKIEDPQYADKKTDAEEFLTSLQESLTAKGELEALAISLEGENIEEIAKKIQDLEQTITLEKEAYIEIIKEQ